MRKISDRERAAWKATLGERQSPRTMKRRWNEFHADIGEEMLVQAGVEFMRDAYVAHRFAEAWSVREVWLVGARRPDFGVRLGERDALYEVTEADWPDRRRGKEYKEDIIPRLRDGTAKVREGSHLFRMTADQASQLLEAAALDKASGGYDKGCGLVILLQPGSWQSETPKVEAIMSNATQGAKDAFGEVWVHWSDRFYLLWRKGQRTNPIEVMSCQQ
jgi:hypothetical protein